MTRDKRLCGSCVLKIKLSGSSPHLAWCPSPMRWGCSSRPGAAAKPEESCRVQSSKRRWQKAEEQRKGQKRYSWRKRARRQSAWRLHALGTCRWPLVRIPPENLSRPYGPLITTRIDTQCHNYHGEWHKNKGDLKQRYRSAVGERRFTTLTLKASSSHKPEEGRTVRRMIPSRQNPLYSLPIIPSLRSCTVFSRGTSKLIHLYTQVSNTNLWPHTPRVPNPVTPGPNTLSASPKGSCAPSLTFSAPICQNHNPYTSPLITRQERYHLKN